MYTQVTVSTMPVFPNDTSSSSSVLQPNTDSVLADPLPCPRAICTIPKDNTAAARVTKLQPTAIQRKPNRWPCHWKGLGGGSYSDTGKEGGRDDSERMGGKGKEVAFRLGVGSDREVAVHAEMRLCAKVWGASINHQSTGEAKTYRDPEWKKQGTGNLPAWHGVACTIFSYAFGKTIERRRLVSEVLSSNNKSLLVIWEYTESNKERFCSYKSFLFKSRKHLSLLVKHVRHTCILSRLSYSQSYL